MKQRFRQWMQPRNLSAGLLTLVAIGLSAVAVLRVATDFAELRRVDAVVQQLETALTGEDLTSVGDALQMANSMNEQLTSQAAKRALELWLDRERVELAVDLESEVPIDVAKQFIEARQYSRARRLAETVEWLTAYLSETLDESDRARLQLDTNLSFFRDIEGWIALRRFRASPDNRSSRVETELIRSRYPAIYAEHIELFQERARQKFTNGLRLLEGGDLQGALESFEVAVLLDPSETDYREQFELLKSRLDVP